MQILNCETLVMFPVRASKFTCILNALILKEAFTLVNNLTRRQNCSRNRVRAQSKHKVT